jgi:hypothetical protein
MTEYRNKEFMTHVGYEEEVTPGTDPAQGLTAWPGNVMGYPQVQENRESEQFYPGGSFKRDVHQVSRQKDSYTVTVRSKVSTPFSAVTDQSFFGYALGTVNATTGVVTMTGLEENRSFTMEWGMNTPTNPTFNLLEGCKVNKVTWTMEPGRTLFVETEIWALHYTRSDTEVTRVGANLTTLTATNLPPVHGEDISYTILTVPGGTPIPTKVRSLTFEWNNDLEFIWSDDGIGLDPDCIIEGDRTFTFTLRTTKISNTLHDIAINEPDEDAGKIDFQIIVNQASGFYMDFRMTEAHLDDRTPELERHLMETWAGTAIGTPTVDFNLAA